MSWIEKRKAKDGSVRYRLRDWVNGKNKTVIKNAGSWKAIALERQIAYERLKAAGQVRGSLAPLTTEQCEKLGVERNVMD